MLNFSVVIPAYNEADRITTSLTHVVGFMRNFNGDFEIIVVDDGSADETAEKVKEYAKSNPEVKLIKNEHRGKGFTVRTGVLAAEGEYIYIADADMAAPIEEIKKFVVWVRDNDFDVAIGSREGVGAERKSEPFYRHLMGRGFNFLVQLFALPGIQDSQCGFKMFKADVARDIFNRLRIYGDQAEKTDKAFLGAFDVEVLYLAKKLGYRIKSIPLVWTYVPTTRLNIVADSYKMARDVIRIRLNDLRGLYNS